MIRPTVFLSYARIDRAAADALHDALVAQGCFVWMDRKEILAGDDFVRSLQTQLGRCDALVLLLTSASAASSWCLAELQFALGRGLVPIVVQQDAECQLPEALQRLLRDIQMVPWAEAQTLLAAQIHRARARSRRRLTRRAMLAFGAAGALTLVGMLAAGRINRFDDERRLRQFVAELRATAIVWSGDEVRTRLRVVRDDPLLTGTLDAIAADPGQPALARVNAWQALDALQEGRQSEWRTYVPQIDWKNGRIADRLWANTTYGSGQISGLIATRMRMAGLVFTTAPAPDKPGLSLIGVRVLDGDIWFMRADGTQMLDVEFENCKFRGAQLDLSAAAGVRFVSREKSSVLLSTDVAIVEDSWLVQRQAPPSPGVMDLAEPAQELMFDGVQFARVRFEGHFKRAWFRNCHFTDCVFATRLRAADLADDGNAEEGSVFLGLKT